MYIGTPLSAASKLFLAEGLAFNVSENNIYVLYVAASILRDNGQQDIVNRFRFTFGRGSITANY